MLGSKYGHQYAEACKAETVSTISEKLKHKLSIQSPPKLLVEKYLIEIAKNYNIAYEPDPQIMQESKGTLKVLCIVGLESYILVCRWFINRFK